jgi:hypothetical protein
MDTYVVMGVLTVVLGTSIFLKWRSDARRAAEMDAGTRCVACGALEVKLDGQLASCQRCGQRIDLAPLRAAVLTDEQRQILAEGDPTGFEVPGLDIVSDD